MFMQISLTNNYSPVVKMLKFTFSEISVSRTLQGLFSTESEFKFYQTIWFVQLLQFSHNLVLHPMKLWRQTVNDSHSYVQRQVWITDCPLHKITHTVSVFIKWSGEEQSCWLDMTELISNFQRERQKSRHGWSMISNISLLLGEQKFSPLKWPQLTSGFHVKFPTFWSKAGLSVCVCVCFFVEKKLEKCTFTSCGSVWPLSSTFLPSCWLSEQILTCVCASLCEVFTTMRALVWSLTSAVTQYMRNSDRQLDWRCAAALLTAFLASFCTSLSCGLMPASLPPDPDVVSCPQSVNSASLLTGTEQLQRSAAKQFC